MNLFRKLFLHSLPRYIFSFLIIIAITCIILIPRKIVNLFNINECISISGAVIVLVGLLSLVGHFGAFDTFGYSFQVFRRGETRKYQDLYEYSTIQKEKRAKAPFEFMPYFLVGTILLIISIVISCFNK